MEREDIDAAIEYAAEQTKLSPSPPGGCMISEVVTTLKARGSNAVMDDEFARDIADGIDALRQPWVPPPWE